MTWQDIGRDILDVFADAAELGAPRERVVDVRPCEAPWTPRRSQRDPLVHCACGGSLRFGGSGCAGRCVLCGATVTPRLRSRAELQALQRRGTTR